MTDLFRCQLAIDSLRHHIRHRFERLQSILLQYFTSEHPQNPDQTPLDYLGVAGKRPHAFSLRPRRMANAFVVLNVVCQVRLTLLGYKPDLQLAYGYASVFAIQMGVLARAGSQLQDVLLFVENPDAGKCRVHVAHDRFCAPL